MENKGTWTTIGQVDEELRPSTPSRSDEPLPELDLDLDTPILSRILHNSDSAGASDVESEDDVEPVAHHAPEMERSVGHLDVPLEPVLQPHPAHVTIAEVRL